VELTLDSLKDLLAENGGVLHSGQHAKGACKVCVRELRCLALNLPEWTDLPDGGGPTDRACQNLNDAVWSSDVARTKACLPLALLTESEAPAGWVDQYALRTTREILPIALRAAGLEYHAVACASAEDLDAAGRAAGAASNVASRAAFARYASNAAYAAYNAAYNAAYAASASRHVAGASIARAYNAASAARYTAMAAYYAANAAYSEDSEDSDAVLHKAVQILVECHAGQK
jgi:hypothetical protein